MTDEERIAILKRVGPQADECALHIRTLGDPFVGLYVAERILGIIIGNVDDTTAGFEEMLAGSFAHVRELAEDIRQKTALLEASKGAKH